MIYGAVALLTMRENSGISNLAHLGGMLFGLLYLKGLTRIRLVPSTAGLGWQDMRRQYRDWKMQRAKKKFQVYMKKHGGGDRDRWVN
jgi:hypothetical protein